MEPWVIRPALLGDFAAIAWLSKMGLGYDYPPEETEKKLAVLLADCRHLILVAEREGRVVGYLHLTDYEVLYAPPMKNIMGIAVDPACRRLGIGRALLKAGEAWARKTGVQAVRLNSGETRTGAHAFYRSLGYKGSKMQLNLKKKL